MMLSSGCNPNTGIRISELPMLKKAMILAAGFGSRLKPLTDTVPKALIPYNGFPMIYNVIQKLKFAGIESIVINTHYLSEQMKKYFEENDFGIEINLVHENEILGTGGAIKNAAQYLNNSGDFLVYNVDVSSDIDINEMYKFHIFNNSFATLAVKERKSTRYLIMDSENKLVGRVLEGEKHIYTTVFYQQLETAFCGIHIISQEIFSNFPQDPCFDIMPVYMDLLKNGKKLMCFDIKDAFWRDLGKLP